MKSFKNKLSSLYIKNKIINIKEKIYSFSLISKKIKTNGIQDKFSKILNNQDKTIISFNTFNPIKWIENLQDLIEKKFKDDNTKVILKQSKIWAKAITWVIISGSTFGIVWLSVAETEEIVIAIGKLEPKGGVIDVQMPLEGVARKILVKEGDKVKKGQLLINLDTEITEARNVALMKTLEINNAMSQKLNFLVNEGAASEMQYLELQTKIEDIKSQIKTNLVTLKYQKILSPADGIVFELQPKGPGYVAKTSQPVLKIVPTNNLVAKVEIESRQIGFVKVGKQAEISIDSFPASDFGAIEGVVESIGSDALPPNPSQGKGYRFPANISLNVQYLEIKNGKKLPLQAGMSLSANIKLRKVTYIQLLLNKFGDKAESLQSI